jgi:hypothetical protein
MSTMNRTLMAAALSLACAGAFAQTTAAGTTQRDANQQTRIDSGLKDGSLSTGEASKLEAQQTHVETMQKNAMKDGTMTPAEKSRITAAQNRASANISAQKHDAQTGNPNSASSQRMQADVARNAYQQQRIANGVKSGALTNHETAKLEAGQSHATARQSVAASNGHVGAGEQASIQGTQNRQSRRIAVQKHDAQTRS